MKPTTLQEAITALKEEIGADGQTKLLNSSKEELVSYHHGLGALIRNSFGLWSVDSELMKHMTSLGFSHPDDVSASIIKECWLQLRGLPSEIQQDVIEYKKFWDATKKDSK